MNEPVPRELLIVIPIYNDWAAVVLLLPALDRVLEQSHLAADVLLVDDGSTIDRPGSWSSGFRAVSRVDVLSLRRNVGHQRAIAIALAFVEQHLSPEAIVVMDGDGEDAPGDVPTLVRCLGQNEGRPIVFAERKRRAEGIAFRAFYALYRWAHLVLTGIPVRVGNFSIIPSAQLRRLVVVSELWNHYAAAVFKAKLPRTSVPTTRAPRLVGQSRMNFVDLVAHGLSALSVHAEVVGVRLLTVTAALAFMMAAAGLLVVAIRVFTPLAIPGWASIVSVLMLILLLQSAALATFFAFLVLHSRSQPTFIPIRDYLYFVDAHSSTVAVRGDSPIAAAGAG